MPADTLPSATSSNGTECGGTAVPTVWLMGSEGRMYHATLLSPPTEWALCGSPGFTFSSWEEAATLLSVTRSTEKPQKGLTGGDSSRWQGLATWLDGAWSQGEKHLLTHSHIQGQKCFSKLATLHNFSFNWGLTNASLNKHFSVFFLRTHNSAKNIWKERTVGSKRQFWGEPWEEPKFNPGTPPPPPHWR